MLTAFELAYLSCEPFLPPLYRLVRGELRTIAKSNPECRILDIGGRKSHYTINVPGRVVISELPRETEIQHMLHLGLEPAMPRQIIERRSNVARVVYDDMTQSRLLSASFDCALAIEVLEHVEHDGEFLTNVRRVLNSGGVFLVTTHNGDSVPNHNPDHKRHYRKTELQSVLERYFCAVQVDYCVAAGLFHRLSLQSWSSRHPMQAALAMLGGWMNGLQSGRPRIRTRAFGTEHLFAIARPRQPVAGRKHQPLLRPGL